MDKYFFYAVFEPVKLLSSVLFSLLNVCIRFFHSAVDNFLSVMVIEGDPLPLIKGVICKIGQQVN